MSNEEIKPVNPAVAVAQWVAEGGNVDSLDIVSNACALDRCVVALNRRSLPKPIKICLFLWFWVTHLAKAGALRI